MVSISDVLKASKGLPVDDIFAELWGRKLSGDYTIAVYTGTLPAVLTGTKAGYLHSYKIYGNTEQNGTPTPENPIEPSECGERTANLWDSELEQGSFNSSTGQEAPSPARIRSDYIHIQNSDNYTITLTGAEGVVVYVYDANKNFLPSESTVGWRTAPFTKEIEANRYIRFGFAKKSSGAYDPIVPSDVSNIMLVSGSTAPTSYIPYGYKLPLTSAGQDVDIYIGDDTLSTEEYVDSGTGKIYRMVDGVLTPTDPPAPFPQIPTTANSTTISWGGQGLAPSEVEFEYERK